MIDVDTQLPYRWAASIWIMENVPWKQSRKQSAQTCFAQGSLSQSVGIGEDDKAGTL